MIFHTPPECQGQIVETSYAADGEQVLRLTVDRSDQSACLSSTPTTDEPFEPWNEEPRVDADTVWTPCTLQSDGEQWCLADADGYLRPLGFALLDSSPYKGMLAARGEAYAWKGVGHWQFADGHTERADAVLDAFDHPGVVITATHPAAALEHDSCGRCGAVGPHFSMHTGDGECLCSSCLEAGTEGEQTEGTEVEAR